MDNKNSAGQAVQAIFSTLDFIENELLNVSPSEVDWYCDQVMGALQEHLDKLKQHKENRNV